MVTKARPPIINLFNKINIAAKLNKIKPITKKVHSEDDQSIRSKLQGAKSKGSYLSIALERELVN